MSGLVAVPHLALGLLVLLPVPFAGLADALFGDPAEGSRAERWYPPVLVGRLAAAGARAIRRGDPRRERWWGGLLWGVVLGIPTVVAVVFVHEAGPPALAVAASLLSGGGTAGVRLEIVGAIAYLVGVSYWLKSCFALRGLIAFCARPLGQPLDEKRRRVGQVVNRPTGDLPEPLLHSALIESAVENTTDSVVAPLLAYGLLGLPGAVAYRSVNTQDALLGHRDRARRYVGEVAAAADRIANVVPDWITALLLRLLSSDRTVPTVVLVDPAVSVPRSVVAASSVAHVRLERRGSYVIGPDRPPPGEEDVRRVLRAVKYAGTIAFLLSAAILGGLVVVGWTFFL